MLNNVKFNEELRRDLFDYIVNHAGVYALRKDIPDELTIVKRRAMGVSKIGKLQIMGERPAGSGNKWERYYAKGTPEFMEYIARFGIIHGEAVNLDPSNHFDIERKVTRDFGAEKGKPERCEEYIEAVAMLPKWGELYTDKGINFFAVAYLFSLLDLRISAMKLLYACDDVQSPFKIRFCQGVPQNDDELIGQHVQDLAMLSTMDIDGAVRSVEKQKAKKQLVKDVLADLRARKEAKDIENGTNEVRSLINQCRSFALEDVDIPKHLKGIQELIKQLAEIIELENELDPVVANAQGNWSYT